MSFLKNLAKDFSNPKGYKHAECEVEGQVFVNTMVLQTKLATMMGKLTDSKNAGKFYTALRPNNNMADVAKINTRELVEDTCEACPVPDLEKFDPDLCTLRRVAQPLRSFDK